MDNFKWAFIGYGGIAHTVAKQLKNTKNKIVAVYGRNYEKTNVFAEKFEAKAYESLDEMFTSGDFDCVYIATPNDSHVFYTEQCILHGKPVLCEKPFSLNRAECKRVLDLAEENNVYVAEAMWTWHNKVSLQVRDWIRSGTIGDIVSVDATYAYPMLRKKDRTSRLVNPAAGGGSLLDIGIYPVRYVYELFGMPQSEECNGRLYNGVDVEENIIMHYDNFTANCFVSFKRMKGEKIIIKGTKGSVTVPFFHTAVKAKLIGCNKKTAAGKGGYQGAYIDEFNDTAQDIRDGKLQSELVPHQATLDTMELLDEFRKQMNLVYPAELDETEKNKILNTHIKAISHLGFNCKNLDRSIEFYCKIMGCQKQFVLTYRDLANTLRDQMNEQGDKVPGYVSFFEKQGDRVWNAYLKWTEGCFIELFDQVGAIFKNVPGNHQLNYTHFSLEVENIRDFRQAIVERGGAEFIESDIRIGADHTLQMWMHDPEGNRFELMEYTKESLQIVGENCIESTNEKG